ncbi:MAG TPA: bifunctional oligoribonuclease/PAP phosphatase NrnA [Spirochaetota bacterium]|jgi:phosphoesterase RecJ-like protein|nr:bifunctional oligoribonuclease/PAP phosphatase NrnA [Spirochaetota bacterium]HPV41829.1 bifunctional oligoribonuclease/PAP phosphatase NrnA [Spirochaetota bacterium]
MKEELGYLDAFLSKYDKFVISTHESPDWDGLGAEIAMFELLKNLGKKPLIINSDPTPDSFQFLDLEHDINVMNGDFTLPDDITEYAQLVLDTNDYDNIGSAYHVLKDKVRAYFIVDHHEGDAERIGSNIVKAEASSACEIMYHIIMHYGKPISLRAAQALFAGIVFDTGSFVYPKTSPETFRIAAHLEELGVVPFVIHEQIYEQNALTSFELRGQILSTMEVLHGGRMIAMKLTPEMLKASGATFTEGEPAINMPLTVKGVVASLLVKQDIDGPVKVSMRTKGELDVAKIAMENGGGGHRNAAGYKSKLSLDETYKMAIKRMDSLFN